MSWGLHVSEDMVLYAVDRGSQAAESEQIRGCMGLAIVVVNGCIPVNTPQDLKDFTSYSKKVELLPAGVTTKSTTG